MAPAHPGHAAGFDGLQRAGAPELDGLRRAGGSFRDQRARRR